MSKSGAAVNRARCLMRGLIDSLLYSGVAMLSRSFSPNSISFQHYHKCSTAIVLAFS